MCVILKRERNGKNKSHTENKIGDEGAKALCEALKTNTTLTSLNLYSEEWKKNKEIEEMTSERQVMGLELMEQKQ